MGASNGPKGQGFQKEHWPKRQGVAWVGERAAPTALGIFCLVTQRLRAGLNCGTPTAFAIS